jgi:hypothetical protein
MSRSRGIVMEAHPSRWASMVGWRDVALEDMEYGPVPCVECGDLVDSSVGFWIERPGPEKDIAYCRTCEARHHED